MKKYNVGDAVWVARYQRLPLSKVCPVCYEKREVVLILGNGDQVTLPCKYCQSGYDPPTGRVTEYEFTTNPERVTITEVRVSQSTEGETVEYLSSNYILYPNVVFDTREEALAKGEELAKEQALLESTRVEYLKKDAKKSFSWNAGYHMREAKRHEKDAEYHREKAALCKARA